jgi:hypothetical protein
MLPYPRTRKGAVLMKGIVATKPEGYEVIVDAIPSGVRMGSNRLEQDPRPVAMLALEYEPSDLRFLTRIVTYLTSIESSTPMYLWNRNSLSPDVALCLDIHNPPLELLDHESSFLRLSDEVPCLRLRVGIAGEVLRSGAEDFLTAYHDHKVALTLFCEKAASENATFLTPLASIPSFTLINFPFFINPLE